MSDPLLEGLQHRDDFLKARNINIVTFYRWRRRGLPVINIGREPFVELAGARVWFECGMRPPTPPAPAPRRTRRRAAAAT